MLERLDALLGRVIEETITEDELVELEGMLDGDVEAQRRYLHTLGLHRDLGELGMSGGLGAGAPKVRWFGRAMLAVAAVLLVGFVALVDWGEGDEIGGDGIARISELSGAVSWTGVGGGAIDGLAVGVEIGGGTLEVHAADSWAEFEFRDGTRVVVSGRSALALSDGDEGKLVRLWRGDLSVDAVPQPEGRPMRVITPSAEAEVLGTQF
ncbi:MAG: FecR family protein, partial [Verrucomicrobiales bacterium]|nr:FecR family protein [Verrucomicrobiales bacterium]